jgi:hypothetical protein
MRNREMKHPKMLKSYVISMKRIFRDTASMRNCFCALIAYCLEIIKIMRYAPLTKPPKLKEIF